MEQSFILFAKFDCPVARLDFTLLATAHDCETLTRWYSRQKSCEKRGSWDEWMNDVTPRQIWMTSAMSGNSSLVFRVKAVCFEVKISVETCSLLDSVWQAMLLLSCFVYWRKLGQPFTWRWEFGLLLVINSLTLFIHDFQQSWRGCVLTDSEVTSMLGVLQ